MSYELIETIELTSSAASIEFTSIPQDGTDLVLKLSVRNTVASYLVRVNFNNDTGNNYDNLSLEGNGSSVNTSFSTQTTAFITGQRSDHTADTFGSGHLYISNYTSSANKSTSFDGVTENNGTTAYNILYAHTYTTTSPITTITITANGGGNLVADSVVSLYKVTAA